MPKPYASAVIDASTEDVWQAVREFNGLPNWHPGIGASELEDSARGSEVGAIRKLTLADGGIVRERLVTLDDTERSYTYDILDSPFPIRSYRATMRVRPVTATGQAFVEWWTHFESEAAEEERLVATFADGVFAAGLTGLGRYLTG
ncbi:MAG: SRPBCC family protein [Pseudonocardiaceae bacterium]|nr:SRPBCC family protein [Pseudonocardiaceae bacterium]